MDDDMRPDRLGLVIDEDLDLIRISGVETPCKQIWVASGHEFDFDKPLVHTILLGFFEQTPALLWRLPGGKTAHAFFVRDGQAAVALDIPASSNLGADDQRRRRAGELVRAMQDAERCRVCDAPITTGELCQACAEGNDPFPDANKWRPR